MATDPVHALKPYFVDAANWWKARGEAFLCRWPGDSGEIMVTASGLLPQGVYTVWFNTTGGFHPAAPTTVEWSADGNDPNRAIVNRNGILNYYIAHLNYDPLMGYPAGPDRHFVTQIILVYHPDGTTHGMELGNHCFHLAGAVPIMG